MADEVLPVEGDEHSAEVEVGIELCGGVLGELKEVPQLFAGTVVQSDPNLGLHGVRILPPVTLCPVAETEP
jgi:hypothetical protein